MHLKVVLLLCTRPPPSKCTLCSHFPISVTKIEPFDLRSLETLLRCNWKSYFLYTLSTLQRLCDCILLHLLASCFPPASNRKHLQRPSATWKLLSSVSMMAAFATNDRTKQPLPLQTGTAITTIAIAIIIRLVVRRVLRDCTSPMLKGREERQSTHFLRVLYGA